MNRTDYTPQTAQTPPAPEPRLSNAERAELQRQGAKAAARGEATDTNPLSQPRNKPPATGESADKWSQRSDAWEQGHEAQSEARRNAEPPASEGDVDEHG
jgi:hypothetical protein